LIFARCAIANDRVPENVKEKHAGESILLMLLKRSSHRRIRDDVCNDFANRAMLTAATDVTDRTVSPEESILRKVLLSSKSINTPSADYGKDGDPFDTWA